MTTDTDLRDLLAFEATGPSSGGAGWDDVVRRGRHRRRVQRARTGALALLAAGAVVTGLTLASDDPTLETTPPATDPTDTSATVDERTTSSTIVGHGVPTGPLTAARVQGAFLTVILPAADPTTGFDPCTDLHPRTPQSSDQIAIELATEDEWRGQTWAACQSSAFSAWGTIELQEPYADQPVIDLRTGDEVEVIDGAPLLFPTELPEPFDVERWDEFAGPGGAGVEWTFSFTDGDLFVNITTSYRDRHDCGGQPLEINGTTGELCGGSGRWELWWPIEGGFGHIETGSTDPEADAAISAENVYFIATSLEPLGG